MLQYMREFIQCGWTLNQRFYDQVHDPDLDPDHYIVTVKKQLDIFLDICQVLFSVSLLLCFY